MFFDYSTHLWAEWATGLKATPCRQKPLLTNTTKDYVTMAQVRELLDQQDFYRTLLDQQDKKLPDLRTDQSQCSK